MNGTVKSYSDFNGYGFILGEDGNDYFAHVSKINGTGHVSLEAGDKVILEQQRNDRRMYGTDIRIVENSQNLLEVRQFSLKRNPFTPLKPIVPLREFCGFDVGA